MGMAMVYLGLVTMISEFGLTASILRHRQLTEEQIARIGGFSVVMGLVIAGISVAISPLIARFFQPPPVKPCTVVTMGTPDSRPACPPTISDL